MIDLHMHTNFSDGTDKIEELVDKVVNKGIKFFSITDHDNIGGVSYLLNDDYLMNKLKVNGIKFIKGVEFSSIIDGNPIHLLGYDYNLNIKFLDVIQISQDKRMKKFDLRLDALKEQFGIEFSDNVLRELREQCDFVGKPIMARYMQKDGICEDYELCLSKYLNNLKLPNYETRVDANIVVPAIKNSSGVCVWAHPYGGVGEPRIDINKVEEVLKLLIPLGLDGIECYYSKYTKSEIDNLISLAEKYNLKVSAGSDYHGQNRSVELLDLCSDNKIVVNKSQVSILNKFKNISF